MEKAWEYGDEWDTRYMRTPLIFRGNQLTTSMKLTTRTPKGCWITTRGPPLCNTHMGILGKGE